MSEIKLIEKRNDGSPAEADGKVRLARAPCRCICFIPLDDNRKGSNAPIRGHYKETDSKRLQAVENPAGQNELSGRSPSDCFIADAAPSQLTMLLSRFSSANYSNRFARRSKTSKHGKPRLLKYGHTS